MALAPANDVLSEIASADLLVTSDNWVAELGQLLGKRSFICLGAIAAHAAIWNFENTVFFTELGEKVSPTRGAQFVIVMG